MRKLKWKTVLNNDWLYIEAKKTEDEKKLPKSYGRSFNVAFYLKKKGKFKRVKKIDKLSRKNYARIFNAMGFELIKTKLS